MYTREHRDNMIQIKYCMTTRAREREREYLNTRGIETIASIS